MFKVEVSRAALHPPLDIPETLVQTFMDPASGFPDLAIRPAPVASEYS